MAAGLLLAAGQVHVRTAVDPADEINPAVVEAIEEVEVDLSQLPQAAQPTNSSAPRTP